ncbi:MAG: hypothetical protein IJB96_11565 [Lachnospira sp.]|nr:hypothetical protein [Lachnospira sp.]
MKKTATLFLVVLLVFVATGCGKDITINGQDNDLIAEYIAGVVLKYNGDGLQQQQQIVIEQNKGEKPTEGATSADKNNQQGTQAPGQSNQVPSQGGATTATGVVMTDLANGLGLNGTTVTYKGYEKGSRYPEDGLFSVPANTDYVIFGFEFDVKNNSGSDIVANTDSKPIMFKLVIDGKTIVQSSSILVNDMTSLKNYNIKSGQTYETAVVFQVPKGSANSTDGMDLQVFSNGELLGSVPGVKK